MLHFLIELFGVVGVWGSCLSCFCPYVRLLTLSETDTKKWLVKSVGFVQGFLGIYHFKSKTQQDEFSPEGLCRAAMYALFVNEELESWPEQNTRNRSWVTIPEAIESCRHAWMRDALVIGFNKWHAQHMNDES